MNKMWQVYYNAVFGAIGGLIAWMLVGSVRSATWNVHLANLFVGAGVGLFIGAALGAVEGLIIKRAPLPTIIGLFGGGLIGLFSGAVGLFLGGFTFVLFKGGLIPRMLGWMALGLFLGVGQGALGLKLKRASYSLIGGTLAGLVGGAFYEILTQAFLQQSETAQVFLSAVGLILIGACLGSITPLSVEILRRVGGDTGLVIVLTGRRANMEKEVIGDLSLGASDACEVYLPESGAEKKQAIIRKGKQGFEIHNVGSTRSFTAGQRNVAPQTSMPLNDNDIIVMGEAQVQFRSR